MAVNDVTITATAVLTPSGTIESGDSGEALTPGDWVYEDSASSQLKLAQCDGTFAQATVVGMILNQAAAAGQPVDYLRAGTVTIDNTTQGKAYFLSDTAGKMTYDSDITTSTWHKVSLCLARSAQVISLNIKSDSGAVIP